MRGGGLIAGAFLLVLGSLSALPAMGMGELDAPAPLQTTQILIERDADFKPANGVTGGRGTPDDPYVLEGHSLIATDVPAVRIRSTTAHFVLRDVAVRHQGAGNVDSVQLTNVANGRVERADILGGVAGVRIANSRNVEVNASVISAIVAVRVESSTDVRITGNDAIPLDIADSTAVTIADNEGTSFYTFGIRIVGSDRVDLVRNRYQGDDPGIRVESSSNLTMTDNAFDGWFGFAAFIADTRDASLGSNAFQGPVRLIRDENFALTGNRLNGPIWLEGDRREHYASHAIGTDNLLWGLPVRYLARCAGVSVEGEDVGQVIVADCTDVRIANLTGLGIGVHLAYVDGAIVEGNLLSNTYRGLLLEAVADATVRGNTIRDNLFGAEVLGSTNVRLYRNNFVHNLVQAGREAGGSGNAWFAPYPTGGNYWSVPLAEDRCSGTLQNACPDPDGIADAPLAVDDDTIDPYPLKLPYGIPPEAPTGRFDYFPVPPVAGSRTTFYPREVSDADGVVMRITWDFGDGVEREQTAGSIDFTFPAPGAILVRMNLADNSGLTTTVAQVVNVTAPLVNPVARIHVSPGVAFRGEPITFDGSGSSDPYGSIASFTWDFGDGTGASGATVSHAYGSVGTYIVSLTVRNDRNLWSEERFPVHVIEEPGYAHASHSAGFGIDVPVGWTLDRDVPFNGDVIEFLGIGPTFYDVTTNVLVETDADATVRENEAYLQSVVDATLADLAGDPGGPYLLGAPTFGTLAGHASVTFTIDYEFNAMVQHAVLVVSEAHRRYWLLLLTTDEWFFPTSVRIFDRMLEGFVITLAPSQGSPLDSALLVVMIGIAAPAAVGLVVLAIWLRHRMRRPPPTPTWTAPPAPFPPGVAAPAGAPQFCGRCGAPVHPGAKFCIRCGGALSTPSSGPPTAPPTGPPPFGPPPGSGS